MNDIAVYCTEMIRRGLRIAMPTRQIDRPAAPANEAVDLLRLKAVAAAVKQSNGGKLLVAAYGSLPSSPEAGLCRPRRAVIPGYRKSLCVAVTTHRGTPQRPGLVAGILPDSGSAAMALVFEAEPKLEADLLVRLARRELFGKPYDPRPLSVRLDDGAERLALGFTASVNHPDVGELSAHTTAEIVARARGSSGRNADYLRLTLQFERTHFGSATQGLTRIEALLHRSDPQAGCGRPVGVDCIGSLSARAIAA